MQPIVLLAIFAVAGGALSVGFLGNTIDLSMVQTLGVGETDLASDVAKANVDFVIGRDTGFSNEVMTVITRNVITACVVQNYDPVSMMPTVFLSGSKVICKLTDEFNNVVAEGNTITTVGDKQVTVTIDMLASPLANDVTNIHDLVIVVQGPSQIMGD